LNCGVVTTQRAHIRHLASSWPPSAKAASIALPRYGVSIRDEDRALCMRRFRLRALDPPGAWRTRQLPVTQSTAGLCTCWNAASPRAKHDQISTTLRSSRAAHGNLVRGLLTARTVSQRQTSEAAEVQPQCDAYRSSFDQDGTRDATGCGHNRTTAAREVGCFRHRRIVLWPALENPRWPNADRWSASFFQRSHPEHTKHRQPGPAVRYPRQTAITRGEAGWVLYRLAAWWQRNRSRGSPKHYDVRSDLASLGYPRYSARCTSTSARTAAVAVPRMVTPDFAAFFPCWRTAKRGHCACLGLSASCCCGHLANGCQQQC
jgi:hypothetical protein